MSDFLTVYRWLNKTFFEAILRSDRDNDRLRVTDMVVKPALAKGENYTSQMLRVLVSYTDESTGISEDISFVVKAEQKLGDTGDIVGEMGLFAKEIQNFEVVLPAVHALLRSIGDDTVLAPKCYATSLKDSYLVFEDLVDKGFANKDRFSGFQEQDFRYVLSAVSKWHAATAVLFEKDPSMFDMFQEHQFKQDTWRIMIENAALAISNACASIPRFRHLAAKFDAVQNTVYRRFSDATNVDRNSFNVLTHGDLWSNNIMFTRDERLGRKTGAILVDYQLSSYGSPLLDIMYALYSSSHEDVTEIEWDQLLQFYHEELSGCLSKLRFAGRVPTLSELHVEMQQRGAFGTFLGIFVVAVRNVPEEEVMDMSRFMGYTEEDYEYRKGIFMNPRCRKELEFLLSYCDRKGLLDV